MDLRLRGADPTPGERTVIEAFLVSSGLPEQTNGRVANTGHEARARRHLLLPALHALQDEIGWISEGALSYVCERLIVPPADAYGVASFYALFSLRPRPPLVAHVCDDIVCMAKGADDIIDTLEQTLGPESSDKNPNSDLGGAVEGAPTWLRSPCLGQCERAPALLWQRAGADDRSQAPVSTAAVGRVLADGLFDAPSRGTAPQTETPRDPRLRLLRRIGLVDPTDLDDYRGHGGYSALRRAVRLGPEGIARELADSKLMGRGGAAFPIGAKWDAVAKAPVHPHYVICNADESEPGTFKDRILMEEDPFALIEAVTIAGYATGAERGYIYIRGEYPLATRRLEDSITQARARGMLGDDVMGEGFAFDIELRRGAGAYICGEETALMNSIEGYRGEPRNKPPFPTQVGLFGKPTAINNVETLFNVLEVLAEGGPAFAGIGTKDSTGTKLFCLTGAVRKPGLYELEFGATLRELLELAGGLTEGATIQAILLGGAAGTFIDTSDLDLPLTFEATRAAGASLGSGVVFVLDGNYDISAVLLRIAAFMRDESCGQCVPCRVGTVRQEEALRRLVSGRENPSGQDDVALLSDLLRVMSDASICGLGFTAGVAVKSALERGLLIPQGRDS
ncbi:MAG: NAD(P)H-dependent oxidoreductase subunit E [Actinomycetota bacterium]|nr:NAD(P)H-dependent oxidoreductase subunit E [Actinomycetota bacterium]